jgi:hypothetical protein
MTNWGSDTIVEIFFEDNPIFSLVPTQAIAKVLIGFNGG